jgi:hypothetical protein
MNTQVHTGRNMIPCAANSEDKWQIYITLTPAALKRSIIAADPCDYT